MFNEVLKHFLNSNHLSEDEELYLIKEIKTIIHFAAKTLTYKSLISIYSKESLEEEMLNDIMIKIIDKRELMLTKLGSSGYIKSYIKLMAINHIKDKIKKKTPRLEEFNKELGGWEYRSIKSVIEIEATDFIEKSKENLTEKEKEALCLELLTNKKKGCAAEKARSRAKDKLKNIALNNGFSLDVVDFAIKMLFISEICKEFVDKVE